MLVRCVTRAVQRDRVGFAKCTRGLTDLTLSPLGVFWEGGVLKTQFSRELGKPHLRTKQAVLAPGWGTDEQLRWAGRGGTLERPVLPPQEGCVVSRWCQPSLGYRPAGCWQWCWGTWQSEHRRKGRLWPGRESLYIKALACAESKQLPPPWLLLHSARSGCANRTMGGWGMG